jgi:hypothetical protein
MSRSPEVANRGHASLLADHLLCCWLPTALKLMCTSFQPHARSCLVAGKSINTSSTHSEKDSVHNGGLLALEKWAGWQSVILG